MKKMRNIVLALTLAFTAVFAVGCQTVSAESYVAIDINPSVELIVNHRDIVLSANPLNEDAEILLEGLDLVGMKLEDATTAIIDKAIELGYIDVDSEETVVSVTTIGYTDAYGLKLGERIQAHVNQMFMKRGIFGYAMVNETMEEIRIEAEELGVSPGKLRLVKVVQALYPELTTEEGLELAVSELMSMIKEKQTEIKDIVNQLREEFQANRTEIVEAYKPLLIALHEEIDALEAAILAETDEAAILALEAELELKKEELTTLRLDFQFEMDELREEFKERSAPIREQIRGYQSQRFQENRANMEQFRNRIQQQANLMNRIRTWQQNRIQPNN